ncbi:MAG: hypothetical protein PHO91_03255 [Patescibacteria group bacterium]|nr:hypothetical protein [Patescibacteria group bacterium]
MPKKPVKIIPAVLTKDFKNFKKQWTKIAKQFNYVQIDIMDGILVKTKNDISPTQVKKITQNHTLEVHLMVKDIASYIAKWQKLKNVKKIIWHYEAETDTEAIICLAKYLQKKKIKAGLAINPPTPLAKIIPVLLYFDTIQIMGVTPGKQGQKFQKSVLKKIKTLRAKHPQLNITIDGGVDNQNFTAIKKAGANIIAIGSYFQKSKKNIEELINNLN